MPPIWHKLYRSDFEFTQSSLNSTRKMETKPDLKKKDFVEIRKFKDIAIRSLIRIHSPKKYNMRKSIFFYNRMILLLDSRRNLKNLRLKDPSSLSKGRTLGERVIRGSTWRALLEVSSLDPKNIL